MVVPQRTPPRSYSSEMYERIGKLPPPPPWLGLGIGSGLGLGSVVRVRVRVRVRARASVLGRLSVSHRERRLQARPRQLDEAVAPEERRAAAKSLGSDLRERRLT